MDLAQFATGGLVGGVATAWAKNRLEARQALRQEQRATRRSLYVEMLTVLMKTKRATERLSFAPDARPPGDIDEDRLDEHDARLVIDASTEVRELARRCYRLASRFWASYTMGAPIDVDEHGMYHYRYDLVRQVDGEQAKAVMRSYLGSVHDEFVVAIDALAERMKIEVQSR